MIPALTNRICEVTLHGPCTYVPVRLPVHLAVGWLSDRKELAVPVCPTMLIGLLVALDWKIWSIMCSARSRTSTVPPVGSSAVQLPVKSSPLKLYAAPLKDCARTLTMSLNVWPFST